MNGPHDMGGMQCYGPIDPETDEPLFHGEWEKKAMAMTVAMGFAGMWNIDASRFMRESLPPVRCTSRQTPASPAACVHRAAGAAPHPAAPATTPQDGQAASA